MQKNSVYILKGDKLPENLIQIFLCCSSKIIQGVLISSQPHLLRDVFCLMMRIFRLMIVLSSTNISPIMIINRIYERGRAVTQWLRHYATNRQVAGSILDGFIRTWSRKRGRMQKNSLYILKGDKLPENLIPIFLCCSSKIIQGVLISSQPHLLRDVFCLMMRIFRLMLVLSSTNISPIMIINIIYEKEGGGVVVKALRYKPAGRGLDSRWSHWNFSVT